MWMAHSSVWTIYIYIYKWPWEKILSYKNLRVFKERKKPNIDTRKKESYSNETVWLLHIMPGMPTLR